MGRYSGQKRDTQRTKSTPAAKKKKDVKKSALFVFCKYVVL
jgi:hypothetical protein